MWYLENWMANSNAKDAMLLLWELGWVHKHDEPGKWAIMWIIDIPHTIGLSTWKLYHSGIKYVIVIKRDEKYAK